jgi:hypothetical protein
MGVEVPAGVLSVEALRQIYEPPLRLIETIEYVREDPNLVEACSRQGTSLDRDLPEQEESLWDSLSNLTGVNDSQDPISALQMCPDCGELYEDLTKHTKKQCKWNQKKSKRK